MLKIDKNDLFRKQDANKEAKKYFRFKTNFKLNRHGFGTFQLDCSQNFKRKQTLFSIKNNLFLK